MMDLDLGGHPLHTRALSVTLAARADGRLDVAGMLLDLRKRGFVPVGGDLQSSGIVHHMLLDVVVDPATGRIDEAVARQPCVAFEASAATEGESCRDPIDTARALVGGDVAHGWPEWVGGVLGGPKACFHVFTLAHLLGATVAWALGRDRIRFPRATRPAGQRVFRRDIVLDGAQRPDGTLALALQLTELLFAPVDGVVPSMQRLGENLEARMLLTLGPPAFVTTDVRVARRDGGAAHALRSPGRRPAVARCRAHAGADLDPGLRGGRRLGRHGGAGPLDARHGWPPGLLLDVAARRGALAAAEPGGSAAALTGLREPPAFSTLEEAMAQHDQDRDAGVVTKKRPVRAIERPKRYKVLLHNDDYTTMEFVVWVLQDVFHHDEATAMQIMLHVHRTGIGVAGVYTREVAEARVAQVEALARQHEFPLRCSMEED
jgi:ATP-dependent Clp protease adaptor protein ClpS